MLLEAYGESALSETTCRDWFRRFKSGDFGIFDKERPGQPKKFEDEELAVLLNEDATQTLKALANALHVDKSTVSKRLQALGMIQKVGKWLPSELTERSVGVRLTICDLLLQRNQRKSFLHRVITGDEKWIQYDHPKRPKAWVKPGEPGPLVPKRNIHGSKIMLSIWWDQEGVEYFEFLPPKQTVAVQNKMELYKTQLTNLRLAIQNDRPEYAKRHDKIIFQHDNARPHVAKLVKNTLGSFGWEVLPHPPYSPDVAPSDYYLFRSMSSALAGQRFYSYDSVKNWLETWISSKTSSFFWQGIHKLPERWEKVVAAEGQYFLED